jgi:hypothetical protein
VVNAVNVVMAIPFMLAQLEPSAGCVKRKGPGAVPGPCNSAPIEMPDQAPTPIGQVTPVPPMPQ